MQVVYHRAFLGDYGSCGGEEALPFNPAKKQICLDSPYNQNKHGIYKSRIFKKEEQSQIQQKIRVIPLGGGPSLGCKYDFLSHRSILPGVVLLDEPDVQRACELLDVPPPDAAQQAAQATGRRRATRSGRKFGSWGGD